MLRSVGILALCIGLWGGVSGGAGEPKPCGSARCGPGWAGMATPCGDTGCGPRYRGEVHEPSCPDPCDACNRWRGRHGGVEAPEMLAPWQLPPGRGFLSAAQVGYVAGSSCRACQEHR